jgi:hypothetical protein
VGLLDRSIFQEAIMPTKTQITSAAIALIAFAVVAYVQRNVVEVPIVGQYLPR